MLLRFVITFLPRSKHLLISWLQSPSAVILQTKKRKSVSVSIVSPSICYEVMGPDAMILVLFFFLLLPVYRYQPISLHPRAHMLSHVIPWTSARQTPLFMDFSRQEYWSGLPFPSPSCDSFFTDFISLMVSSWLYSALRLMLPNSILGLLSLWIYLSQGFSSYLHDVNSQIFVSNPDFLHVQLSTGHLHTNTPLNMSRI